MCSVPRGSSAIAGLGRYAVARDHSFALRYDGVGEDEERYQQFSFCVSPGKSTQIGGVATPGRGHLTRLNTRVGLRPTCGRDARASQEALRHAGRVGVRQNENCWSDTESLAGAGRNEQHGRQQLRVATMTHEFSGGPSFLATPVGVLDTERDRPVIDMTGDWGDRDTVSSYLERCQVDTPATVVAATWKHVRRLRPGGVGTVLDLGAGDGRFAQQGVYESYVGYEIDARRCARGTVAAQRAVAQPMCILRSPLRCRRVYRQSPVRQESADPAELAPEGPWRTRATDGCFALGSGECLAVLLLERPCLSEGRWSCGPGCSVRVGVASSAEALRNYIREQRWTVCVYRLREAGFARRPDHGVDHDCRQVIPGCNVDLVRGSSVRRCAAP